MSNKVCDHKSVGIIVKRENKILFIERKKPPYGFAPPAGHVDNKGSFENAAKEELKEEVGLTTTDLIPLIEGRKNNPCRRKNGSWHYWKIYKAKTKGKVERSESETKQVKWLKLKEIKSLAKKTNQYLKGKIDQEEWEQNPGLEPVWLEWFKELKFI